MQYLDSVNNSLTGLFSNQWVSAGLILLLILCITMVRPQMPNWVVGLFDNTFFRLLVLFTIAYLATKNTALAIVLSIAFALIMAMISEMRMARGMITQQF